MALGIKKITESVIEDGRSLIMIGTFNTAANNNTGAIENFDENRAIPIGALLSSPDGAAVRIKVGENEQVRLNADETLEIQSVTNRILADNSVTTLKIKDQNVTTAKLADSSVTTIKIKDLNVTTEKLADACVTTPKLANYAVTDKKIANGAVITDKIKDSAVTTIKIKDSAITTSKILDSAVTENKIANNAVTYYKIKDSAVIEDKIANGAVTTPKISDGAVTESKIDAAFLAKFKDQIRAQTDNQIRIALNEFRMQYRIDNMVRHDGQRNVNGTNDSTPIINLKCSGDIEGNRVYFMTYQDLAEAYVPGEDLEAGDIVAMHEDGKVYKAESMNDCIVGVISNEFANCFGATKEELFNGSKVAVGMIGKVHVKVKGPVSLGQKITVSLSEPGAGMAWSYSSDCIGKALETIDCDFDEINEVLVQIRPM
jgi:hypothetical protein